MRKVRPRGVETSTPSKPFAGRGAAPAGFGPRRRPSHCNLRRNSAASLIVHAEADGVLRRMSHAPNDLRPLPRVLGRGYYSGGDTDGAPHCSSLSPPLAKASAGLPPSPPRRRRFNPQARPFDFGPRLMIPTSSRRAQTGCSLSTTRTVCPSPCRLSASAVGATPEERRAEGAHPSCGCKTALSFATRPLWGARR